MMCRPLIFLLFLIWSYTGCASLKLDPKIDEECIIACLKMRDTCISESTTEGVVFKCNKDDIHIIDLIIESSNSQIFNQDKKYSFMFSQEINQIGSSTIFINCYNYCRTN